MTSLQSFNARTGEPVGPSLPASSLEQIDASVEAALNAFTVWSASTGATRAQLLSALAQALETDRDALVALADEETALGPVRLQGELDRTAFQLRRFADLALQGAAHVQTVDPAVPGAPPAGHPSMVRQRVPLGPVAMFAASNFPFAFSVLGGDTASALAAGCSVVVKAHPGHPRLSGQVFALLQQVLEQQALPAGLIGMVQGGNAEGVALLRHPAIAAGAFTGSTRGGAALQAEAQSRTRPIPFYGELGSINPVVALPSALEARSQELATMLAGSITLGCGQFCTSPGVIIVPQGDLGDAFVSQLAAVLASQTPHAMLTAGMRQALHAGVAAWLGNGVAPLVHEPSQEGPPRPFLGQVPAQQFIEQSCLREEVFGPAALVVRVASTAQAVEVLKAVEGSLTVTLWGADSPSDDNLALVRNAMSIAGRVLFTGVPTGVAVTAAQQHGGPWPSSTQPMTTSVGDAALERFLRPVALQDAPQWLLLRAGRPC